MESYYVKPSGNNDLDGLSKETAWATLEYALEHAPLKSEIIQLNDEDNINSVSIKVTPNRLVAQI